MQIDALSDAVLIQLSVPDTPDMRLTPEKDAEAQPRNQSKWHECKNQRKEV